MKDAPPYTDDRTTETAAVGPRRTIELDADEALRLLGSVPLGRIVFTRQALPAIRPVNHLLEGGDVVIRTHEGSALTLSAQEAGAPGVVVAYEADAIDSVTRLGWSAVVTGYCHLVTDPAEVARYRALLEPWSDQHLDQVVRIRPDLVTGIRLVDPAETSSRPLG
ncbi:MULTISPECIES: pyridoxamine 5'-phosphate oxidase family protein [unclassified Streptomyces]|uniref:pyridoxamine 5'-phosphate oxidase family protein n=1 Tax=unclassified Streptomyces TaxID=2593676 RepID=UPI0016608F14|nr:MULTISPECIES: pyridoxamine 5'-phosphate oxidase family protein [unclassified Streptomyces]MBD0710428.1 pyridoxamine 5'-phosphate oxidase [Streptomyces sp. CBMA291]MBD0712763.1 pyridoxamine 5'-phosphate oxidase [Streptomyces sp. CBMA370]